MGMLTENAPLELVIKEGYSSLKKHEGKNLSYLLGLYLRTYGGAVRDENRLSRRLESNAARKVVRIAQQLGIKNKVGMDELKNVRVHNNDLVRILGKALTDFDTFVCDDERRTEVLR